MFVKDLIGKGIVHPRNICNRLADRSIAHAETAGVISLGGGCSFYGICLKVCGMLIDLFDPRFVHAHTCYT